MKLERERSPIQAVVEPLKDMSHHSSLREMDCAQADHIMMDATVHNSSMEDFTGALSNDTEMSIGATDESVQYRTEEPSSQYSQFLGNLDTNPRSPLNTSLLMYPNIASTFQENLSQLEGGISKLQQDMSQVIISADGGDSSLQSLYLERLQELVPWVPKDEELPKLQLVQAVIDYIHLLQEQLEAGGSHSSHNVDTNEFSFNSNELCSVDAMQTICSNKTLMESNGVDSFNSCHHSSSSSLSPSPSSSLPTPTAGQSHLFPDLEQKQLANELHHLHAAQRDTSEEHSDQQQMVDKFINQQGIIDDLRHMRMKDPACERTQHMVSNHEDHTAAEHRLGMQSTSATAAAAAATSQDCSQVLPPPEGLRVNNFNAISSQQADHYNSHGHHFLSYLQSNPQYQEHSPHSNEPLFPFPAPPSPQTIKAVRKKKQLMKKIQGMHSQQNEQSSENYFGGVV